MKFTMRAIKPYPAAQTLGFFDVELRYFGRRCNACLPCRHRQAAAIGYLIYNLARYEQIVRLKPRPRIAG